MRTITPLTGIPQTGSSTSESAGKGKQYQPRQGQVFKALVLAAKGDNVFSLDIGGNKLPAQSQVPLKVGQTLQLQVTSTSPQYAFKIVAEPTSIFAGKPVVLLGNKLDLKPLLQQLLKPETPQLRQLSTETKSTIETFRLFNQDSLGNKDGGINLKQLIDRIGISFESLLQKGDTNTAQQSLKNALLEIATVFKGAEKISDNTTKLLNTLELYQLSQIHLEKENLFIFPLPIPFLENGYLLVEQNTSDAEETDSENNFSLHLSLHGLGNIQIDITKSENGVFLKFISDSPEKIKFIQSFEENLMVHMISSQIQGISYGLADIDPAADLLKRVVPDGSSLVNTKV